MKRKMTRLKTLIKREHMSQQDFADWFCIARFTAWQVLNEKRQLKGDEIVKICMRFDVSADWLLGLSNIERPWDVSGEDKLRANKDIIWKTEPLEGSQYYRRVTPKEAKRIVDNFNIIKKSEYEEVK